MRKQPTVIDVCVDNTWRDYGGQVLSAVDDNRHLITVSIPFCVQRDGRLGMTALRGPSALDDSMLLVLLAETPDH